MKKTTLAFLNNFPSGISPWHTCIILCLAVLASYASVWPNGFVFDDKALILDNVFLRDWDSLPKLLTSVKLDDTLNGFYRPVQMLVYFLIYQTFGLSTVAFHALNIGLQALNAGLLHHFGIRAGFKKGVAFAAALLWAVHPVQTIDVASISSTAAPLYSAFCLMGLIALLPDFTPRKVGMAMIFYVLALGCKESAVVFPALAAVTLFFASKERTHIAAYLRTWPLWLLTAGYIAVWLLFIHWSGMGWGGDRMHFQDRVLTSLATLPVYAGMIVWPTGLHVERIFPVFSTLQAGLPAAGALMMGLGLLQIMLGWGGRALSFGFLWFVVAMSPVTGIVTPVNALISEGWLYLPMMGLFLGAAQTAAVFFKKRQDEARLLVLALAVSLGIATFFQNEVWRTPETLYQNILQNGGRIDRISTSLGLTYMEQGEFDKATKIFQYEIDHGNGEADIHLRLAMAWLHISPDKNNAFAVDASTLQACQHIPEAIGELGRVLQDKPDYYLAHQILAAIYRHQGNNRMANFHDRKIIEILQKQGYTVKQ